MDFPDVNATKWVSEKKAAHLTGLSVHTLRAQRFHRRGLPYYKVGKSVRYCVEDIEAFMCERRITPTEQ